ncbi:MAG TPA: hypothetical protein VN845_09300, partial [Solirubrobacteraceae bacterium]|nr:hypothetical protein [Solirubrobacteraceae bacterium]
MPCVSLPAGGDASSIGVGVGGAGAASVVVPVVSLGGVGAVVVVVVTVGASTGVLDGSCACVLGSWVELVVTSVSGDGVAGLGATGTVVVLVAGGVAAATRVEAGGVFGASG